MHDPCTREPAEPDSTQMARSQRRQRGGTLAMLMVSLLPVMALVGAFYSRSITELQLHTQRKAAVQATMRAIAGMEIARNEVANSTYSGTGNNDRIRQALAAIGPDTLRASESGSGFVGFDITNGRYTEFTNIAMLPANTVPFILFRTTDLEDDQNGEADDGDDKVSVWIANLTGSWHMFESRATVNGVTRTARMVARERDPFTRFSIFIDAHYQGVGGTPKGDIHTNQALQIFYPDGSFDDFVSARTGFQYLVGASAANTAFNAGSAPNNPLIPMPSITDIQSLEVWATGTPYYVSATYENVEITFQGDQVTIFAKNRSTGVSSTLFEGPLPPNGIIYAERSITKLSGDVNGRVTVVTEANTTISGSIRYVDADGDPVRLNPTDPSNYISNPEYDGNSAVGIMSNGPVLYATTVPATLEVHAAVFSSTGNVGVPGLTFNALGAYVTAYNASFRKDNLMILGTTIADKRFVGSVVNYAGTLLSGFADGSLEYDRSLLNNPPPHFLELDRPLFRAIEILENTIDV